MGASLSVTAFPVAAGQISDKAPRIGYRAPSSNTLVDMMAVHRTIVQQYLENNNEQ